MQITDEDLEQALEVYDDWILEKIQGRLDKHTFMESLLATSLVHGSVYAEYMRLADSPEQREAILSLYRTAVNNSWRILEGVVNERSE